MLRHTRTLGIVQVDGAVWKRLSKEEKVGIEKVCEEKLETYYQRLDFNNRFMLYPRHVCAWGKSK